MKKESKGQLAVNRRAYHDYEILETFEAGMVLKGTEVKSLRESGASLQEAYVRVLGGELWLFNASIAPYRHGSIYNHEEKRQRKLLMHKREIVKLESRTDLQGMALVPLALYLKNGCVKLSFGLGKGRKLYDKRAELKKKEHQSQMQRALRK